MIKISGFIIAKNEEQRIANAINSMKDVVSEIIVVDSGSTDNTVNIAKELGAKVVYNTWEGYVKQKAFAESLCTNDWILNLDADEELTKDLQHEIQDMISSSDIVSKYVAFIIKLVILHNNDQKPRFLAPSNQCIRLYNRNFCSFANSTNYTTHDVVRFNDNFDKLGKIFSFKSIAWHRSTISISQLSNKLNFYSSEQAKDFIKVKRKPNKLRIIFEMFIYFLKSFFIRRYFILGFDGFIYAMIFAFFRFLRLAKAYELKNSSVSESNKKDGIVN